MNILGMDTTGTTLSVALSEDEALLSEIYIDSGKKHSQTLMAAVDDVLRLSGKDISDVDVFAVCVGPGSFTGIRIGVAACAAMAHAAGKPVAAVSTLDALMENAPKDGSIVCAVMDARREEVYTAAKQGAQTVVEECALPLKELVTKLLPGETVVFVGDAALKFEDKIRGYNPHSVFLPPQFIMQRASSVCALAYRQAQNDALLAYDELCPRYLRESQAERLRKESIGK
ncbi:MAG: tRNA (adenosine(37)-N6)-threonylcarbamoyltransferase complex dimerization subunit type 1 TsaB [Christensenella sp.]|uniref:tRNA (adenosine(37)-N6)-threonylcarbamoyltransferase complex dimerization subunit type 1 TsaB n=1 Tax=Christensenella sp. TaxID=1935934 RepID=UPI002B209C4B|nr:tRNA (adenosine(37)-N6)-threonylcarbamoyltransferase complex dimerization subunit type 1 TsaB [Christensenella sp.]MEA5004233.1 tRNA (adenosine(37)-N6)-threonylcarbamoyltransferase complex dimerization subunit type 1 TsaB [Christensenella sp.]